MRYQLLLIALVCCICGCAPTTPPPTHEQIEKGPLAFIVDGKTSREDVLLRLGTPTGQFEADRVLTFRLAISRTLELMPTSRVALTYRRDDQGVWLDSTHDLIIVFDDQNTVQKHNLIQIREPR